MRLFTHTRYCDAKILTDHRLHFCVRKLWHRGPHRGFDRFEWEK